MLLIFCCSGNKTLPNSSNEDNHLNLIADFERKLEINGVTSYGIWKVGEKPAEKLFYLIKHQTQNDKSSGQVLSIFDNNKKLILRV